MADLEQHLQSARRFNSNCFLCVEQVVEIFAVKFSISFRSLFSSDFLWVWFWICYFLNETLLFSYIFLSFFLSLLSFLAFSQVFFSVFSIFLVLFGVSFNLLLFNVYETINVLLLVFRDVGESLIALVDRGASDDCGKIVKISLKKFWLNW